MLSLEKSVFFLDESKKRKNEKWYTFLFFHVVAEFFLFFMFFQNFRKTFYLMHKFRSLSYSGIPVDGWDYVHSPLLKPQKKGEDLVDLVLKEEEEKNHLEKVVKSVVNVKTFLKNVKRKTKRSKRLHLVFWIVVTIFCGCAATIPCELILKEDNMGTRINCLATYVFVIASTSVSSKHVISNRHIPITNHLLMVCTTLAYNLLLTYAFSYHLPITLALILKNGSLVFQMCVGMFFLIIYFFTQEI